MSKATSFDPAKLLTLFFRISRAGSKKLVFLDANAAAYNISAIDFQLIIKRWADGADVLNLGIGTGLTVGGAGSNELTIEVTEEDTTLATGTYFWQLYNVTTEKTWLNGDAHFHNGKFDAPTDSTDQITITTEGDDITITIADGSSGAITNIDGGTP